MYQTNNAIKPPEEECLSRFTWPSLVFVLFYFQPHRKYRQTQQAVDPVQTPCIIIGLISLPFSLLAAAGPRPLASPSLSFLLLEAGSLLDS